MAQVLRTVLLIFLYLFSLYFALSIKRALYWIIGEHLNTLSPLVLHLLFNLYTYIPLFLAGGLISLTFDNPIRIRQIHFIFLSLAVSTTVFQLLFYLMNVLIIPQLTLPHEMYNFIYGCTTPFFITGIFFGIILGLFKIQNRILTILIISGLLISWLSLLASYCIFVTGINLVLHYCIIYIITCTAGLIGLGVTTLLQRSLIKPNVPIKINLPKGKSNDPYLKTESDSTGT